MSDQIVIPPASAPTTGFVFDGHRDGHHHIHDYARTAERVLNGVHAADINLLAGLASNKDAIVHGTEEEQENFAALARQISDSNTQAVGNFKDALGVAYQIEGRTNLEAAKNFNAITVQNAANFAALQLDATKNAAASALAAAVNQAATLAAIAECCCETKELIRAENEETRNLINSNTIQHLRDVLTATQRLVPVVIPVPA